MLLMKKDMAGAANAIGLFNLLSISNLHINLRLIIPCAENMVSGHHINQGIF